LGTRKPSRLAEGRKFWLKLVKERLWRVMRGRVSATANSCRELSRKAKSPQMARPTTARRPPRKNQKAATRRRP